ncbi:MAG: uroporphyrinogen decarboxylase [Actinobacteria bacterium HGW-Actinobacteria-5]|nr:MAG: uroporphyrinogen decarboxylase [Actinobacteria bacterium HGW-Actinobacteria-5]
MSVTTTAAPLLEAYRGRPVARRPVWFMRQAGRSLPEYRRLREGTSMLQACLDPELAAEITCQPVRRHDVDAGIFFSDIVVPLRLAGVGVEIVAGVGPVLDSPVRTPADVAGLPELDPAALAPVRDGVALSVAELGAVPLIGFAGAPFTLASYLVEGRPNRELPATRALLASDPDTWHRLLAWVAGLTTAFLRAQVEAGASAIQLFDSWVGRLSPAEYRAAVQPHSAAVFSAVTDLGVPRVHFGTATRDLLPDLLAAGADVVGVASDIGLDEANALLGGTVPLQGNLDPALLAADWPTLEAAARDVVRRGAAAPGHVFNLGHGVPPETDPDTLTRLVELVHSIPPQES